MLNRVWRWAWVGGVFTLFGVVVWTAFGNAPPPGGPLPVVRPAGAPVKEVVTLPPIERSVPASTVLNLLAEADDPAAGRGAADVDAALAADGMRREEAARLEAALDAIVPGEAAPTRADQPRVTTSSLPSVGEFRIQLAAVKPGQEMLTYTELQERFPSGLTGLGPRFQAISTDNGVLVRVQAGPLSSEADAEARCREVRQSGGACFVVPTAG